MSKRNIFILVPLLVILVVFYISYKEIPYEDYQNYTLKEMQKFNSDLEKIIFSYANKNDIDETYVRTLYDCDGSLIYTEQ